MAYPMVPTEVLDEHWPIDGNGDFVPVAAFPGNQWLVARGGVVGDQTRLHVMCSDMGPNEIRAADLANLIEKPSWIPVPNMRTGWIADDPGKWVPTLYLESRDAIPRNPQGQHILTAPLNFRKVVESSQLAQVWKLTAEGMGWSITLYASLAVDQDVVEIQGSIYWDSRSDSKWNAAEELKVRLICGDDQVMDFGSILGMQGNDIFNSDTNGYLPRMMAIPFYGALIAKPEGPIDPPDESRYANAMARKGGPILGLADVGVWSGHVGPHKAHVYPFLGDLQGGAAAVNIKGAGNMWADRLGFGAPRDTGRTGDYGVFGRWKAVDFYGSRRNPAELQSLRWGFMGDMLRGVYFNGDDGKPMGPSDSDSRTTYAFMPHYRVMGPAWNLPSQQPWGAGHGRFFSDPQHRGNMFNPAAVQLLGDFVMMDHIDRIITTDTRDVRIRNTTFDAARACGRMLQEWAGYYMSASTTQREQLIQLAHNQLEAIKNRNAYSATTGPMKVVEVMSKDWNRNPFYPNHDMWAPWQQSFVVDGLIAWADIFLREGMHADYTEFLTHAVNIANTVINHGIGEYPGNNFVTGSYVRYNPDGQPNAPDYWDLNREGAQTDLVQRGGDLVYGGISQHWYSGPAMVAAAAGNQKAKRFLARLMDNTDNLRNTEWMVGIRQEVPLLDEIEVPTKDDLFPDEKII